MDGSKWWLFGDFGVGRMADAVFYETPVHGCQYIDGCCRLIRLGVSGNLLAIGAAMDRQPAADSTGACAVTCGRTALNRAGQTGLKAERVVKQNGKRPAFRQRGNPSRARSGNAINHLQAWNGHSEVIVLGESDAATLSKAERATAFHEMQSE
jgi:hypothetical protein